MTEVRKNSQNLHLHGPGRFCCALSCTMPFWGECHGQRSWEWLDVAGEAVVASALNWLSWYSDETRMNKHEQWDMVRHGETLWNYQIQHHEARHQAWFCRQNWDHVESACVPEDLPVSVSEPVPVHKLDRVKDGWHPSRVHFSVFEQLCFLFSDFSWTFVIWLVEKIGELAFMLGNSLDMIFP